MEAINELIRWLIQRMEWVYGFVVNDLHLPSKVGYVIIGFLVVVFFYDLYDIYQQRKKSMPALIWLLVVLLIPLGTLIYLFVGRYFLHNTPLPIEPVPPTPTLTSTPTPATEAPASPATVTPKAVTTTVGTIVGVIAAIAGAIGVAFFVLITIAIVQCQNDPKCM